MVLERNKILWRGSSCEYVGEQEPSAVVLGHSPSWQKPDGERLRSWRGRGWWDDPGGTPLCLRCSGVSEDLRSEAMSRGARILTEKN